MACYQEFYKWCTTTLPGLYDESLSYYDVVCKLTNYVKSLYKDVEQLSVNVNNNETEIEKMNKLLSNMQSMIAELETKQKEYEDGKYSEVYVKAVYDWIKENMQTIVDEIGKVVHFVTFGLSANGYFQAFIPTNWDFIEFTTNMTPKCSCWGHLILNY